jgi:uncharacterized membrane protein
VTDPIHRSLVARPARLVLAASVLGLALAGLGPALVASPALAASTFSLTTPYPEVVVAPGASVSFDVAVTTPSPERVTLALSGVPTGWTALIHGGGNVIDAVETGGTTPPSVTVDVTVPASATGTSTIVLTATAAQGTQSLPLQVRVEASAAGDVTMTTDFPSLQGPATQTFDFNLTLSNQTAQDLTFAVNAQGPSGWTVSAQLTGQSQAASAVVKAGSTSGITVSAQPPSDVAAGTYQIKVVATAGSKQIPGTLQVVITGSYSLSMSTPDQNLSTSGSAGQSSDLTLTLTNGGTAPITNVKMDSTPPTGWTVTFDPATIASLDAGKTQDVVAHIVPSSDALAGDYIVTMKATGDQSTSASSDIRYTVETSLEWALVGIALIVLIVAGLGWVFRRYGRR